jgi:hypothetical protein
VSKQDEDASRLSRSATEASLPDVGPAPFDPHLGKKMLFVMVLTSVVGYLVFFAVTASNHVETLERRVDKLESHQRQVPRP